LIGKKNDKNIVVSLMGIPEVGKNVKVKIKENSLIFTRKERNDWSFIQSYGISGCLSNEKKTKIKLKLLYQHWNN